MTIKQQGGIFGRNPTYNDVTVDGSVSVNGSISVDTISEKTSGSGVTIDGFQAINGGAVASANSPKIDLSSANANGYNYRLQSSNTGFFTLSQLDGSVLTGDGIVLRYNPSGYFDIYQNLAFANGKGIDFSATGDSSTGSMDNELFDDYEEGTWTPEYIAGTGAFTSVTYDAATAGLYTKVGNIVHAYGRIRTDAITVGTASGTVSIGGLPFTNTANFAAVPCTYTSAFAGDQPNGGYVLQSSTNILLYYKTAPNTASLTLDVGDLNTGANRNYIVFSATYQTA